MGEVISTAQALVFIAKAIINLIMYMQGLIERREFESRMREMSASIYKATNGPLETRVEGGREVENQINQHAPGKKP